MTDPAALLALKEKCAKATGPDREIDAEFVALVNNAMVKPYPPTDDYGPKAKWQFWSKDSAHFLGNASKFPVAPVTASIDAALALVERTLPEWTAYELRSRANRTLWGFELTRLDTSDQEVGVYANAKTAPLAILSAMLAALMEPKP